MSTYDKRSTETHLQIGILYKLAIGQFVNTALIILVVNLVIDRANMWKNGGIVYDSFFVVALNAVFTPFFNIFDPWYFYRLC